MMMRGTDVEDGEDNDGGRYDGEGLLHQDDGNLVPGVGASATMVQMVRTMMVTKMMGKEYY